MQIRKTRDELLQGKTVFDLSLRVTFYARVSTDKEEQLGSLENQAQYYEELIQGNPNWTYVEGYVDEGISGTETRKRESFLRMIRDGEADRFDLILTKEISRFSRSTLDSIRYTRQLLECGVGVLFQSDGINTLDPDSELRLVIMAGVAQDEVRKLSERLRFGFRQSIRNGRVLGNDSLWGYRKQDGRLTVDEEEAPMIRRIFQLYGEEALGIRKLSARLLAEGFRGRSGEALSTATLRSILQNPKYKGWYCGNKSRSTDYRTKRRERLPRSEWVTYPDPAIPAIVPEALWDRVNALYARRAGASGLLGRAPGRYPYSGKVFCQAHAACCHRKLVRSGKGERELWCCPAYRREGRAGCAAPSLSSQELDRVLTLVLARVCSPEKLLKALEGLLEKAEASLSGERGRTARAAAALQGKRERLLDLRLEGAISPEEFRRKDGALLEKLRALEGRAEAEEGKGSLSRCKKQRKQALERELSFADSVQSEVGAAILERAVVLSDSAGKQLHLRLELRWGQRLELRWERGKASLCCLRFL